MLAMLLSLIGFTAWFEVRSGSATSARNRDDVGSEKNKTSDSATPFDKQTETSGEDSEASSDSGGKTSRSDPKEDKTSQAKQSEPNSDSTTDATSSSSTSTIGASVSSSDSTQTPESGSNSESGTGDSPIAPILPTLNDQSENTPPETSDPIDASEDGSVDIEAGRTSTLELEEDSSVSSIKIVSGMEHGNVTVNPDNTFAVVLTGTSYDGPLSFKYEITFEDGSSSIETMDLNVTPLQQEAGWGVGEHYMLAEDQDGDIVVETGDNHRPVYVSKSADALSKADIASLEDLSESQITTRWLIDNPEYGGSEGMALQSDIGMSVWNAITSSNVAPSSNWLLFERGYDYGDVGRIVTRGAEGESELHPVHITAWGEGERPIIGNRIQIYQEESTNVVISDLQVTGGANSQTGENILFTDMGFTKTLVNIYTSENFTLHDSEISYTVGKAPEDGELWDSVTQGLFIRSTDGILLEGNTFHHNAWEDDYNYDLSSDGGMVPNTYSHNVYLQWDTLDVTYRDNISSQSASFGAQLRGGAFAEDNVFLDNNVAVSMHGGDYKDYGHVGNFTFFADNLITSAGYKEAPKIGATSWGIQNNGIGTTWLDNIIAHLADPENPDELSYKIAAEQAIKNTGTLAYDDTIVFNWLGADPDKQRLTAKDQNTENVDAEQAMKTTIQNFAAGLLADEDASISDLMDYILSLPDSPFDDDVSADDIIAYFQDGFNVDASGNGAATEHRFVPNDIGDGVRWDNRVNWNNEELPDAGDTVDLGGNWVQYGGTTSVDSLDLGAGGQIHVNSGRLEVEEEFLSGGGDGLITTNTAGQIWINGYEDTGSLAVEVGGGRFANTGDITGDAKIHVTDGQAIIASDDSKLVLQSGSELRIEGSEADVGFDGEEQGISLMQMAEDSTLSFVADKDGFSDVSEFRSGNWGDQDEAEVKSGVSLDGTLNVDLTDYDVAANGDTVIKLIKVDALDGVLDDIHVYGLSKDWDAEIVTDYEDDELFINISSGSGAVSHKVVGEAGDSSGENDALWNALTAGQGTYDESPPNVHDENSAELETLDLG